MQISFKALPTSISKILYIKLLHYYCKTKNNIKYFASFVYLELIASLKIGDSFIAIKYISQMTPSLICIIYNKLITHFQEDILASHILLRQFYVIISALI